ncbi:MAG: thymidine phosphorylase [Sciscionella sp.]
MTTGAFSAVEVIRAKRDGHPLSDSQIDWVLRAYTDGIVAEEQMAALAMAICCNGMDARETARWTEAMINSGERLSLSTVDRPTVDKHSTGGVGDKITLVLAPLVASCGVAVPQLSGRGLGHTGGTLDKLESIPGWQARLSAERIVRQLHEVGAVVAAATEGLAPADRKLYALRDVTGTVESIPLIASSIMSKKIAEGAGGLVLDVKVGSGAFMKDVATARELADVLVAIGTAHGVLTSALLTDMASPLWRAVGNAVEVAEAVRVLQGGGPPDVAELAVALAREMLAIAGLSDVDPAEVLADGGAYETWCAMIRAQSGDPDALLPRPTHTHLVEAPRSGIVSTLDAYAVGVAAWRLGAGRARREDAVSAAAGLLCLAKPGERVATGQPLFELHTDRENTVAGALAALDGAVTIGASTPQPAPLVLETLRGW